MSWVKAVLSSEDVFDENADDLSLQSKEWDANMKKRFRDGYVDGVDDGEEASLQLGFNQGFREGAARTVAVGRLKGIVSAIFCWCRIEHPESPVPTSVTDLLQRISQYEDTIMNGIKEALDNPPPSVSSVSESMEDLDVKPAESDCCGGDCTETGCCKGAEKMDPAISINLQQPCSVSTNCSSTSRGSLDYLMQRCISLVPELGLPEELIVHIKELNML